MKLEIFDRSSCCSKQADPVLDQASEDLQWVAAQGVEVKRYDFAREPQAFTSNSDVLREMGVVMDRLPITVLDGKIVAIGAHLSRIQLAQKLGLGPSSPDKPNTTNGGCCTAKSGCC